MLNIENLKCGFGKHEILHGISLTIPKGQITAIVGQSGCGKTTFLKTLNRMVEEEGGYLSGTITLEGTDIKSLPKEKLRRPPADRFPAQYRKESVLCTEIPRCP